MGYSDWQPAGPVVNIFIFQSVPERYDLRQAIVPGKQDTWYATRYRSDMHPGDLVFFWMAGAAASRGVYGWGHLVSAPYLKPGWDSHGVDVEYEVCFRQPLSVETIRSDPTLAGLLIFRAPSATNFLLSGAEAEHLIRLAQQQGETVPAVPA